MNYGEHGENKLINTKNYQQFVGNFCASIFQAPQALENTVMEQPLVISPPYIRKPTALIHFERELSVVAQKVMTLIVAHCQKATKDTQGFYFIEKRKVCEFLDWEESHNQSRVVEVFQEIYNNDIVWNLFGQDRTFTRLQCRLIFALLSPSETGRYVGFAISPLLEPVITLPKVFGQILFDAPALLTRSEYAFPLYELLADHVSRADQPLRIALSNLKQYLGIKRRYPIYSDFVKWVLTPSLESINAHTDLQISYETWKHGRAVNGLLFSIKRNERVFSFPIALEYPQTALEVALTEIPTSAPPSVTSSEERAFLERLARHQISEADAVHALQTHGLAKAREIFGYVRQEIIRRKGTPEEIRNGAAYLARCLRDGYGVKCDAERDAEVAQETARAARSEQASAVAQVTAPAQTAAQARGAAVKAWFAALPTAEQVALEQTFLQAEPLWAGRPANSTIRAKAFQRWLAEQGS